MATTLCVISALVFVSVFPLVLLVTTVDSVMLLVREMQITSASVSQIFNYWNDLLLNYYMYVAKMQVNFIYTYSVDMDREQEGFFIVTPPEVNILHHLISDVTYLLLHRLKKIMFSLLS